MFLDSGHQAELGGKFLEAFLLSRLGESLIHIGPLIVLAISGCSQILGRSADAVQLLEPHFGMFFLIFSSLQKQGGNLLVTLFLGCRGKIGVFVASL